jgi:hypothetical protein
MFLNIFLLEKHHGKYILIKRKLIKEVRKNVNIIAIMKEFKILKYFFKVKFFVIFSITKKYSLEYRENEDGINLI